MGKVEPNSPAHYAGVREGDVLIGYSEHPIASMDDLQGVMKEAQVGYQAMLSLIRRAERLTLPIVPEESRSHQTR